MKKFIYFLNDPETELTRYVGATVKLKKRIQAHWDSTGRSRICEWNKELRARGLRPEVEVVGQFDDWEDQEQFYISYLRHLGFDLLNSDSGGMKGRTRQPDVIKRIADANRGKIIPEEVKAKLRGRKLSPEHVEFLRKLHTGRKRPPETGARISATHNRLHADKIAAGLARTKEDAYQRNLEQMREWGRKNKDKVRANYERWRDRQKAKRLE